MQRDGPDHQGQGERQVQAAGDVHVHLRVKKKTQKKQTRMRRSGSFEDKRNPSLPADPRVPPRSQRDALLSQRSAKRSSAENVTTRARRKLFFNEAFLYFYAA